MPIRNSHRVGDFLRIDEESGMVHYASETQRVWDGTYRHHSQFETRQPQEFVRAGNDPRALSDVRPHSKLASPTPRGVFIGSTTVRIPTGPGSHLYIEAIGSAKIGSTFIVR